MSEDQRAEMTEALSRLERLEAIVAAEPHKKEIAELETSLREALHRVSARLEEVSAALARLDALEKRAASMEKYLTGVIHVATRLKNAVEPITNLWDSIMMNVPEPLRTQLGQVRTPLEHLKQHADSLHG